MKRAAIVAALLLSACGRVEESASIADSAPPVIESPAPVVEVLPAPVKKAARLQATSPAAKKAAAWCAGAYDAERGTNFGGCASALREAIRAGDSPGDAGAGAGSPGNAGGGNAGGGNAGGCNS